MSSRITPEESVVCQHEHVRVCRYPVHMCVNKGDLEWACGLRYSHIDDSNCGDRDPGAARGTECSRPACGGNPYYTYG